MRHVLNTLLLETHRGIRGLASQEVSLYALLDVPKSASISDIKRAFRQKAKKHHPDVKSHQQDSRHFARILVAYQVLSNTRQRQLYDLSLQSDAHTVRSAAEQGAREEPEASARDADWVPGDGWFARATKPQATPTNPNQIDKLRAELRTEFNAAVRHAYLGPRVHLGAGQLPEAFEGEERSVAGVGDVMHLVSGQQLLGVVRERQDLRLSGSLANLGSPTAVRHLDSGATSSRHSTTDSLHNAETQGLAQQTLRQNEQHPRALTPPSTILELSLEDKPVAVAVRQFGNSSKVSPGPWRTATADPASTADCDHQARSQDATYVKQQQQGGQNSQALQTTIFDMNGAVLATELEGHIYKGGGMAQHTHTVLTGQTPLVRHMHVVANASGEQELSICRCRRAWLPPASTWLFPPRSQDHASGGWYFEWSGHVFHRHPAWLHPAVFVLLAAMDTLKHEAINKETHKLQGQAAAQGQYVKQEKLSKAHKAKQWLSSMLQFHKQPP